MSVNYFHNFPQLARDSGFMLNDSENDGPIDWRFIASVDCNRVVNESDFEKLEECLPHLIKSAIGTVLNTRILDPAIGKFYVISQLSLQYLLFCKQFLDKTVNDLRENIFQSQKNVFRLEKILQKREDELNGLQKKLLKSELTQHVVYPCTKCTKNFVSLELLNVHINRKHPAASEVDKDTNLIQTIKLELEIKQLKERLNLAERELIDQKQVMVTECTRCKNEELHPKKFHEIGIQSNIHEEKEIDVKETKEMDELREMLSHQMKQFELWKTEEEKKYNKEVQELRGKLNETIELLKQKEKNETKKVHQVQVADKCLDTDTSLIQLQNRKTEKLEEENLWKIRCKEMEISYQENQRKTSQIIENLEKVYSQKMKDIESSVNQMKESSSVELQRHKEEIFVEPKISSKHSLEITEISDSEQEAADEFKSSNLHIVIDESSSSEVEIVKSPEKVKVAAFVEPPPRTTTKLKRRDVKKSHISKLQKVADNDDAKHNEKLEVQVVTKVDSMKLFNSRLKSFGIHGKDEKMGKHELNKVNEAMVKKREELKKKYKSFFITRKQLQVKLDALLLEKFPDHQISNQIPTKRPKSVASNKRMEIEKSTLKAPQIVEVKKSPRKHSTETEKFEVHENNKQTVEVQIEKPTMSQIPDKDPEIPKKSPQKIREDLERMLQKQLEQSTLTLKPSLSDHEDTGTFNKTPVEIPKIVNKKKVLFNLDTIEEDDSKPVVNLAKHDEMNSDSDWNISSFEEDEIELKK